MKLTLLLVYAFGYLLCLSPSQAGDKVFQPQDQYESAIRTAESTEYPFVLITVINGTTLKSQNICIPSSLLQGAILHEHELPWNNFGRLEAEKIALANTTHTFTFSKEKALNNIPTQYTENDLKLARNKLNQYSNEELIDGFRPYPIGSFQGQYQQWGINRNALACALIERQLLPFKNGSVGSISIKDDGKPNK